MTKFKPGDLLEITSNNCDHPSGHDVVLVVSVREVEPGHVNDMGYIDSCGSCGRLLTMCRPPGLKDADGYEFYDQWEVWECYATQNEHWAKVSGS